MNNDVNQPQAEALYLRLQADRQPFLDRAKQAAYYTHPHLVPTDSTSHIPWNTGQTFPDNYQSLGARGVNSLASKVSMVMIPPDGKFFKYSLDERLRAEALAQPQGPEQIQAIEGALVLRENAIARLIELSGARLHSYEAVRHLLVTGNAVLKIGLGGDPARLFGLYQFVVRRDHTRILDLVISESIEEDQLSPEDLQALHRKRMESQQGPRDTDKLTVYTHVRWDNKDKRYYEYQQVEGVVLDGTQAVYAEDALPYLVLRWTRIEGENYGRGMVEEIMGDLRAYETLSASIIETAGIAAWHLYLLRPGSVLNIQDVIQARNGGVLVGLQDDLQPMTKADFAEMRVAFDSLGLIEQRLSAAFLMTSSIQRNAERVTAEEVRRMASELEASLGGVYTLMSEEFQRTLVTTVDAMNTDPRLPKLNKSDVKLTILTGVSALGRADELDKIDQFLARANQALGPEQVAKYINVSGALARMANALTLETAGFVRSPEEIQQMEQQAQMAAIAERAAPNIVNAAAQQVRPA